MLRLDYLNGRRGACLKTFVIIFARLPVVVRLSPLLYLILLLYEPQLKLLFSFDQSLLQLPQFTNSTRRLTHALVELLELIRKKDVLLRS